jgi:hypothetical protein
MPLDAKRLPFGRLNLNNMPYSTCCGAYTNMEEYGICPGCKEHCDFEDTCIACGGEGEIATDEETVKCSACDGSGMVEISH